MQKAASPCKMDHARIAAGLNARNPRPEETTLAEQRHTLAKTIPADMSCEEGAVDPDERDLARKATDLSRSCQKQAKRNQILWSPGSTKMIQHWHDLAATAEGQVWSGHTPASRSPITGKFAME